MKKQVGMREILAMKAQARTILDRMIPALSAHGEVGKHFKGSHDAQSESFEQFERMMYSTTTPGGRQLHPLIHLGYRIMENIAKDQPVAQGDLDKLADFLDSAKGQLRFHPEDRRKPFHRVHPHAVVRDERGQGMEYAFAEDLLDYMNLCALYGREHEVCEQCGALMITGRGGKKFCSPDCRKAYWSYDRQKDYYAKKRKKGARKK